MESQMTIRRESNGSVFSWLTCAPSFACFRREHGDDAPVAVAVVLEMGTLTPRMEGSCDGSQGDTVEGVGGDVQLLRNDGEADESLLPEFYGR